MQARSEDINDITNRLLDILSGNKEEDIKADEPTVILAEELSPSEIMRFSGGNTVAFATVAASTQFSEFPEVEIATSTSPESASP